MAKIVDYATLTSEGISYLERSGDPDFVLRTDTFIALAEDSFSPMLMSRRMEITVTLTTDASGVVALPADFVQMRSLQSTVNGSLTLLPMFSPDAVPGLYPVQSGNSAAYAYISGNNLYVSQVTAATDVVMTYYADWVGLTAVAPTNWIILNHPTLYLFGFLEQASIWLQDYQAAANFGAKATVICQAITDRLGINYSMNAEITVDSPTP